MKKTTTLYITILFFALVMFLPIQAANVDLVYDEMGLLSDDQYFELNEIAGNLTEEYKTEISLVIVKDIGESDVNAFANYVYEENNYGYGEDKSGLMLLLSMADRDIALISKGYGDTAFTEHGKDVLLEEYLFPKLGQDKYYEGFLAYFNQSEEFLKMAKDGTPFDLEKEVAVSEEKTNSSLWMKVAATILIPLLIAFLVVSMFSSSMKTAVPQRAANNYMSAKGLNLTTEEDEFLFTKETRKQIADKAPKQSLSSGNGEKPVKKNKF